MWSLINQPPSSGSVPIPSKPTNHLTPSHPSFPRHLLKHKRSRFHVPISHVPTNHGIPSHDISLRHCVEQLAGIPNDAAFSIRCDQRSSDEDIAV
uniref:Uncharacterized protein n=1 Tax=Lotus japonicus TaxID=34305 RepID=I3SPB1_LOTJA|nr:unknown [Lotus japonicus]